MIDDEIFSSEKIINKLIKKRISLAKKNHDKNIINNYAHKDIKNKFFLSNNDENILQLMPPRRTWVKLGQKNRTNETISKHGLSIKIPCDSLVKNELRIKFTINRDMKKDKQPQYIVRLNEFIAHIQTRVNKEYFFFNEPKIIPIDKSAKTKELRPLTLFNFEDNIILQLTNKFLTIKFDYLFQNCSYAFRAIQKDERNTIQVLSHHDTIKEILKYREKHKNSEIYVAECDLKKFFDTINHFEIKKVFYTALEDNAMDISYNNKIIIERIFLSYLNIYDFQKSVLTLNNNTEYLKEHNREKYKFPWIDKSEIYKKYLNYPVNKIGIPQGGALSGLIANLVLNQIDKSLINLEDKDLLYLRYCDDMIMLNTSLNNLNTAFELYLVKTNDANLFVHKPVPIEKYSNNFYNNKSKLPYRWGPYNKNYIPWISFVGYQISYEGYVRVRKVSLDKEKEKQNNLTKNAIIKIQNSSSIKSRKLVINSVVHRLLGMSVGRIFLYSDNLNNSMCWTNGFKSLNNNYYSRIQMKELDRNRRKNIRLIYSYMYYSTTVKKKLYTFSDEKEKKTDDIPNIIYFGAPYSYYYWLNHKKDKFYEKKEID